MVTDKLSTIYICGSILLGRREIADVAICRMAGVINSVRRHRRSIATGSRGLINVCISSSGRKLFQQPAQPD